MVRAQARTDRRRQVRKLKELRAEVSWRIYGPVGLAARLVRKHIAQSLRVLRRAQQRAPAQHLLRRGLPTLISRAESTQSAVADLGSLRVAARMLSFTRCSHHSITTGGRMLIRSNLRKSGVREGAADKTAIQLVKVQSCQLP